jgi:hypothetical protein
MLTGKQCKNREKMMPRGPKGPPDCDANAAAILIAEIAPGDMADAITDDGKNAAAVALGRMGGKARAAGLSARKRKEIARKAAQSRWTK